MAHKKINVPIIAITPDAEEDDDHNYSTLADALTDVETLEFDDSKKLASERSRSKLKIKLTRHKEVALTDTEDMEGSEDDVDVKIVPYKNPVSIDDLDLDPGECKETHKMRSRNSHGRRKLHTQSSTVTESNSQLRLDDLSVTEGTTDVEECAASDEDPSEEAESMVPDYLLEEAITTQISDKLCISAPANAEADLKRSTDVEKLDSNSEDEQKVTQRRKVKRRRQKVHDERRESYDSDASSSLYNIKFGHSMPIPGPAEEGLTDVEVLDSNDDNHPVQIPVAIIRRSKRGNSTDEEILSDPDVSYHIRSMPEPPLPKPYRKLITVRDTPDRPIVTITPIDDTYTSELRFDYCGDTDEEFLSDTEALLFAEALSRGPTPELSMFEGGFDDVTESVRMRRRRSLKPISPTIMEELTDTEELVIGGRNRKGSRYLSSVTVSRGDPFTDTEDLFLSDYDSRRKTSGTDLESLLMSDDEYLNEKVDLLRALSTTPVFMREMGGDTVLSKDGESNRLRIGYVSPIPTDSEDVYASDAEERPQEVMYLRGGSFREVCTDTEEGNASDDEYHACLYKKKFSVDILSDNNVLVSMKKTCANLKDCPEPFRSKIGKGEVASGLSEPTRPRQSVPFRDVGDEGDADGPTQGTSTHFSERQVADQHQLSEEMKQLLRDMEDETKK